MVSECDWWSQKDVYIVPKTALVAATIPYHTAWVSMVCVVCWGVGRGEGRQGEGREEGEGGFGRG